METKICRICKNEKNIDDFRMCNNRYRTECRSCEKEYNKKYQKEHGKEVYEKRKEKAKKYRELHKEENSKYQKEYYKLHKKEHKEYSQNYNKTYVRPSNSIERHKQKSKEWREKNKEHIKQYQRKYNEKHKDENKVRQNNWKAKNKEKIREYQKKDYIKRQTDTVLKLKGQIRNMLVTSFKKHGERKSKKLEEICKCDIDLLIIHLYQTFKDNYGYDWDGIEKVHIDHIIPLATANTEEDIVKLCNYSNLQLLKAKDNLSKGNRLDWRLEK